MDYVRPIDKKRATLTFGLYPDITLAQARSLRANLKADLAVGVDPFVKRKAEEGEQRLQSSNTFAAIGEECISRQTHLSEATRKNNRRYVGYLNKSIGDMPISSIKPINLLDACKTVESKGYLETALKMKSLAGQVFRYGVQTAKCERDVTQDLKGALKQPAW